VTPEDKALEESSEKAVPEKTEETLVKIKPKLSADIIKLLKFKAKLDANRPGFVRCESWRLVRVKENWRAPMSHSNKMRLEIKGWPAKVKSGYGTPRAVRKLHPSGFKEIIVYNPEDLDNLNPATQAARIAHTVGRKKRLKILEKAKELHIRVLNPSTGG
jgi:large subunit ribosomal protein L32e